MELKVQVKKYLAFGILGMKEEMLYPINLLGRIIIHLVRVGVYILIYQYLISISPEGNLGGLTLVEASWSVAIVQIIGQSCRHLYKEIKNDVKIGAISVKLNKPYNYINSLISKSFIEGLFKMLIFYIVTTVFLYTVLGIPSITPFLFVWIIIMSIWGLLLNILVEILIGLSSFWLENSDPVYWVVNRSAWVVNGMMVPVALLPVWAKTISTYYPLSIPFVAGRAFESGLDYFLVLGVLVLWIILLFIFAKLIFKKAEQKVTIHGG